MSSLPLLLGNPLGNARLDSLDLGEDLGGELWVGCRIVARRSGPFRAVHGPSFLHKISYA